MGHVVISAAVEIRRSLFIDNIIHFYVDLAIIRTTEIQNKTSSPEEFEFTRFDYRLKLVKSTIYCTEPRSYSASPAHGIGKIPMNANIV